MDIKCDKYTILNFQVSWDIVRNWEECRDTVRNMEINVDMFNEKGRIYNRGMQGGSQDVEII